MRNETVAKKLYIALTAFFLLVLLCLIPRTGYAVSSGWTATYGDNGCEYQIADGVLTIRPLNNGTSGYLQNEAPDNHTSWPWYVSRSYIQSVFVAPGVKAGANLYGVFRECGAETMDLSNLDTSEATNMEHMFSYCGNLTTLNVSGWDTSKVTNMSSMFYDCYALESPDLSTWDTSNVTDMESMFYDCYALESLDLSAWNTSEVENMAFMFTDCKSLASLDVTGQWNTSSVTDMKCMFSYCEALTTLDASQWDTSKVTDMESMFDSCKSLVSLAVSQWDVSNVTNMDEIFAYCSKLTGLDLSGWNPCKVPDMGYMFTGCSSLQSITFSENFSTAAATNMGGMFNDCASLQSLTLPEAFEPSMVTDMSYMFHGCSAMESLSLPETFDTSEVTTMQEMFSGCSALESLELPDAFDTSKVTNVSSMFYNCSSLQSLEMSANFNTSLLTSTDLMFDNCSALESLTLPEAFDTSNVTNMAFMFNGCESMKSLNLPETFNTSKVTNMAGMFSFCSALESLNLPAAFDTSNVTSMAEMFSYCSKLQTTEFLAAFNTANVVNMESMFSGCTSLETLILPASFDTSKVTDISWMFFNCRKLQSLDLSNCNTANVSKMRSVFNRCDALKTIYVDSTKWSTVSVKDSEDMFKGCTSLAGGKGTVYNAGHLDASYAKVDCGTGNPGYLSKRSPTLCFAGVPDGILSKTYGDASFTEAATGSDAGITYSSGDPTVAEVDSTTGTVTVRLPGTTTITASAEETSTDYASEGSYTLTVVKAKGMTLTCEGYSGVYDGQLHGPEAVSDIPENTTVTYSVDNGTTYSETVPQIRNAGSVTVLARAENPYYITAECEYILTVEPRVLTVTGTAVSDKVYDTTLNASVTMGTLCNVVDGEDVSIAGAGGAFYDAEAGENKPVCVIYSLSGPDFTNTDNYTFDERIYLTASITAKPAAQILVSGIAESYTETGSVIHPVPTDVVVDGVAVSVDSCEVTYPSAKDYISIDTGYQVKISLNGNYSGEIIMEFEIRPRPELRAIELTSVSAARAYDGTPLTANEVTVTSGSILPGDTLTYNTTGSQTNVGCAVNRFTYSINAVSGVEYSVTCVYGLLTVESASDQSTKADTASLQNIIQKLSEQHTDSDISVELRMEQDIDAEEQLALQSVIEDRQVVCYSAALVATIDGEEQDIGDSNEELLTVTRSFDYSDCTDIRVYRVRNGAVEELTETPNDFGEYVTYDPTGNQLSVTACKYTAFCMAFVMDCENKIIIPENVTEIALEAYAGSGIECVILPKDCTKIDERAFADCAELKMIEIPALEIEIADDAFDGSSNVVIVAASGSSAQEYAETHQITYVTQW